MTTTRRLAAILAADVAGYSRLMAADEVGTLEALKACRREVVDPAITTHNGRIVKTTGDGMLVEFASAVDAVICAMTVQEKMGARGGNLAFRIGINVGDIIVDGDDIFGDGVNVAARVEGECQPGGVCLAANAVEQVRNKTAFLFDDLGEKALKNIDRPIGIYRVRVERTAASVTPMFESAKPLPLPDKPSIAVLPFRNMGGDPEQEYFADGLTENLTTDLSRFRELFVIGRNSAFSYKGRPIDLKEVGRDLGVRYLLEGSVQGDPKRVRVNVQLFEASSGTHLWSERFDRPRASLFEVQDEIARRVAWSLSVRVKEHELQGRKRSNHPDSIEMVLRASAAAISGTDPEKIAARLDLYQQAVSLDPSNVEAWANIAVSKAVRVFAGWSNSPEDDLRLAMEASQRALSIDPNHPQALFAKGQAFLARREYVFALEAYEHAKELNPSHPNYHQLIGVAKIALGRAEEAFEPLHEALRLSPRDMFIADFYMCLGYACWELSKYSDALGWLQRSIAQNARIEATRFLLASTFLRLGNKEAASTTIKHLLEENPSWTIRRVQGVYIASPEFPKLAEDLRLAGLPE